MVQSYFINTEGKLELSPEPARDEAGGRKQMLRKDFDALGPIERSRLMREGSVELVDE
jgi:hypothetical protein